MEDDKQHDIREVYFAVHHLLKYRGNFLVEGDLDSSSVFDSKNLLNLIGEIILCVFDEQLDGSWTAGIDKKRLADTLCTTKGSRSMRVENALAVICESCVNICSFQGHCYCRRRPIALFDDYCGSRPPLLRIKATGC